MKFIFCLNSNVEPHIKRQNEMRKRKREKIKRIREMNSGKNGEEDISDDEEVDGEKRVLEGEVGRMRDGEKERRMLNERVVDLEEELKRQLDGGNAMNVKLTVMEEQREKLLLQLEEEKKKVEELKRKVRNADGERDIIERSKGELKKERDSLLLKV